MEVMLVAARSCPQRRQLQWMLHQLNIPYRLEFADTSNPIARGLDVSGGPILMVDGRVLFREVPEMGELRTSLSTMWGANVMPRFW